MRPGGEKLAANILKLAESRYLTKTKLMKLAFLVEYEAQKMLGGSLSNTRFSTDKYGVVCYDLIEELEASSLISSGIVLGFYGREQRFRLQKEPPGYTPTEEEHIKRVVRHYEWMSAGTLGRLTKEIVGYDPWERGLEIDIRSVVIENDPSFREQLQQLKKCDPADYCKPIPVEEFLALSEDQ